METRPDRQVSPALLIILGVAGLGAVGFLVVNVLGGGGEETIPLPTARAPGLAQPPVATATPTPTPTPEEMEVFEIFEGRDPFRPLVFESGASPGPGESPAPTAPGATAPPRTAPPPRSGVQVEVLAVAQDSSSATVRVGSNVHQNVRPGGSLSSGVVMRSIEGRCVNFRRGADTFRLCEGEQTLK